MKKNFLLLLSVLVLTGASAQVFANTLSLNGQLTLDVHQTNAMYDLEVSVRNHNFVVIPPAFTILRPITSNESTLISFESGITEEQISNEYLVNNILTDPVDYSIQIRCLSCSDHIPTQYFSPTGNKLGLVDSVYIDPADFPANLDLTLITRAFINGQINLNKVSEDNLEFSLSVLSKNNPNLIYQTLTITLPAGQTTIDYRVTGLSRSIGSDLYQVAAQCLNCFGESSKPNFHPLPLSPNENHPNIDFTFTDIITQPMFSLTAIIQFLLNEDEE